MTPGPARLRPPAHRPGHRRRRPDRPPRADRHARRRRARALRRRLGRRRAPGLGLPDHLRGAAPAHRRHRGRGRQRADRAASTRGGRRMTGTKPTTRVAELPVPLAARPHARGPHHLRPGDGLRRRRRRGALRLRRPAHRPARLPRRRRLRDHPGRRAARRLRLRLPGRARAVVARPGARRPGPADGEEVAARRLRGLRAARPPRPPEPGPGPAAAARPGRRPAPPGGPALHPGRRHQGVPALPRRRLRRPGPRLPLPRRRPALRHPRRPPAAATRASRARRTAERGTSAPRPTAVDVVVVGSGHNGLVAACYLARAGLSVEVVESDDVLGGAVSTVERWPGRAGRPRLERARDHPAQRHRRGARPRRPRPALRRLRPLGLRPGPGPGRPRPRRPAAGLLGRPRRHLRVDRRRLRRRTTPRPTAGSWRCGAPAAGRWSPRSDDVPRPPAWSAPSGRSARRPTAARAPPAATWRWTSSAPATRCSTAGSPASG